MLGTVLNMEPKMIIKTLCQDLAEQQEEADKQITIIKMWEIFIRSMFQVYENTDNGRIYPALAVSGTVNAPQKNQYLNEELKDE